jgi:outer membrane immunogenic protein
MKKFLLTALFSFATISLAHAADMALPVKAPPPAPWYDWSGFYLGLNGGYSWGRSTTDFTVAGLTPYSTAQNMDGWLGGGQIGYNWQFNRNWILGIEADIQGTGQDGSVALPSVTVITSSPLAALVTTATTTGTFAQKLPWFGTVRARLGVEPADRVMLYVTGGLAYGEVDSNAAFSVTATTPGGTATTTGSASASNTQVGWTVGGGLEWAFWQRWSAKVEYLYIDFGTFSDTLTGIGAFPTITASSRVTDNIFRVGVNYSFGGPAKY